MKTVVRVVVSLLISGAACAILAAGLVDDGLRSADRFEATGEYFNAAEAYLRVLRLEPGNQKAKRGLGRVAEAAMSVRLAAARELEDAMMFADAVAELERAVDLRDRLQAAGITREAAVDVNAALDGLVDRWVANLLDEAVAAQEDGLWSAAVANLRQVETLRPDRDGVRAQLHDVWMAWGDRDLEEGRLRAAAQRYREAAQVPGVGGGQASRRAASILARLGVFALEHDACRSAVGDLRAAALLAPDEVDAAVLRRAEACALTCVSVSVVAEPELGMGASQVEGVKNGIRSRMAGDGSEFLMVVDRGSPGRAACGTEATPGVDDPRAGTARRYRVAVAARSQSMLRSPATSVGREFRTTRFVDDKPVAETVVVVRVYEEVFSGTMTGSITITDQRNGRTSPEIPVRVTGEATAQWVKSPASSLSTEQVVPGRGSGSPPPDPRLQRLSRVEDRRQEARARLAESLNRAFADEVARLVLETVDAETGVTDPSVIDLAEGPM